MPTYDYECTSCKHTFEYFQPMSAEQLKECPECKGVLKRKIGTGAGPIFKGSGFYQTDYKASSSQNKQESKPKETSAGKDKKPAKDDKKIE